MKRKLWQSALGLALVLALLAALSCSSWTYYGQAAWGQVRIMMARSSIVKLVEHPATPADLRHKLRLVLRLRDFAVAELMLPDNGSYRSYVALAPEADGSPRRSVVWNVVAAPELSTEPLTWCFPVAGCVSYRGYFSKNRASRFADRLGKEGYDVSVGGASAYSTLGWFQDPVLSTVIDYPEVHLAGLIFHELAHQVVYVTDDTRFNESFATAVEIEGVRRWLEATGQQASQLEAYLARMRREEEFSELVLGYRDQLQVMYGQQGDADLKRRRKQEIFTDLQTAYRELRASWGDVADYDGWFRRELNNAHLVSVGAYHQFVPGFQRLLKGERGDMTSFYEKVRSLGEKTSSEREQALSAPIIPTQGLHPGLT